MMQCNASQKEDSSWRSAQKIKSSFFAKSFDFPVGKPNATGYYNAQKFGKWNRNFSGYHLGEDWNGIKGGNTDLGDPVYNVANGVVIFAEDAGSGWGNVVRVLHKYKINQKIYFVESLYAHLQKINVSEGKLLSKGEQLGTIGNANGSWIAHLHFEMRNKNLSLGGGYAREVPVGFVHPTDFIKKHRSIN